MKKYDCAVYTALVNSGYSEEQTDAMDPREVLEHFLAWEGIIGYDGAIGSIMDACAKSSAEEENNGALYEVTHKDGYGIVHKKEKGGIVQSREIGRYEINGDGCYAFVVNDCGDSFFFGHAPTEENAVKMIEGAERQLAQYAK
jgi:hypothetical protein